MLDIKIDKLNSIIILENKQNVKDVKHKFVVNNYKMKSNDLKMN
jgi:hypothetical protein